MTKGAFILIDGPNGTGKSTAMRTAAEKLRADGYDVLETREPGGTPLAEKLRGLVLDSSNRMDTVTQLLIFNAARRSHIQEVINPNVEAGRIVLCDRFLPSSLVFQSLNPDGTPNLSDELILDAHRQFCFGRLPDLTLYLDAPLHVRRERIAGRAGAPADRFEEYESAFDIACAEKFQACVDLLPNASVTIDASGTPEAVAESVHGSIREHLAKS